MIAAGALAGPPAAAMMRGDAVIVRFDLPADEGRVGRRRPVGKVRSQAARFFCFWLSAWAIGPRYNVGQETMT
jgi:hypothetical protein